MLLPLDNSNEILDKTFNNNFERQLANIAKSAIEFLIVIEP